MRFLVVLVIQVFMFSSLFGVVAKADSIFDGAGSLVAPDDDCFGCNRDYVRLHKHSGKGSTGVFQFKFDSESCQHVNIYSSSDLGIVSIKSKGWSGDSTTTAFKVKLNAYDKVSLLATNAWTTFAVTTDEPLKSKTATLVARCASKGSKIYIPKKYSIPKGHVDVESGYSWTGTGSLITQSSGYRSYGQTKDWAHTFETKKSLTSFQWYANSGCQQVVISKQGTNNNAYVPINSIFIKRWDDSNDKWKKQSCQSKLPCLVKNPYYGNGYYVLKILTNPHALDGGQIQVTCK